MDKEQSRQKSFDYFLLNKSLAVALRKKLKTVRSSNHGELLPLHKELQRSGNIFALKKRWDFLHRLL